MTQIDPYKTNLIPLSAIYIKTRSLTIHEIHQTSREIKFIEIIFFYNITFIFVNVTYEQACGTPTRSKISPIPTQYVMDDLIDLYLRSLSFDTPSLVTSK